MIGLDFERELESVLPADLPRRDQVITKCGRHLALIVEANQHLNLTRITTPREAAIKHVLDSLIPWRRFSEAKQVLDAGTGAGFPGIPLAIALPETRFVLTESIQKKARFVDSVIETLELPNVDVEPRRAEEILRTRRVNVVTARAVAPIKKALELFGPAVMAGAKAILYKGPDAETDIAAAMHEAKRRQVRLQIVERYELPDQLGSRTVVEILV